MSLRSFMLIAGEPSGDSLAAELVLALKTETNARRPGSSGSTRFFGAGGPQMAAAGVELAIDLTQHAVVGLVEAIRHYPKFKRLFDRLVALALEQRPDVIVCVDFSGFNRRFARQIRWELLARGIKDWQPRIVQYVSPQVWASRPGRARAMARDFDLVLAIFPFEKQWYAKRVPGLSVEFVGHPMFDRYAKAEAEDKGSDTPAQAKANAEPSRVVLLPGSRTGELKRHLPVLIEAWKELQISQPAARSVMVLPNESLAVLARTAAQSAGIPVQVGQLADALRGAALAIASTGTVTMECAYFRVPTIALYKTSWSTYQLGKRIIHVKYLAMPNLLADESVFPELIQDEATGPRIAQAALELLKDTNKREQLRAKLGAMLATLGGPGASQRAAKAILSKAEAEG
jgi:lipid-A-disaccharide synthase